MCSGQHGPFMEQCSYHTLCDPRIIFLSVVARFVVFGSSLILLRDWNADSCVVWGRAPVLCLLCDAIASYGHVKSGQDFAPS
jgi:hypothetical protein